MTNAIMGKTKIIKKKLFSLVALHLMGHDGQHESLIRTTYTESLK